MGTSRAFGAAFVAVILLAAGALPATAEQGPPVITSFEPAIVLPGAAVTVHGSGLDVSDGGTVEVNGQVAQVTSATDTAVSLVVPAVGSGPITVSSPGGIGTSQSDLYITPTDVTPAMVGMAQHATPGEPVFVTLTVPEQVALLTMTLAAGERLALDITASTLGGSSSPTQVTVMWPDGQNVAGSADLTDEGAFLEPAQIAQDGTYTVIVDPLGNDVGGATITALIVPDDELVPALVGGDPVPMVTTVAGQNTAVVFSGNSGERIGLLMTASTYTTSEVASLQLYGPDGTLLTSSQLASASEFVEAVLPVDGVYTLVIDPDRTTTGQVDVQIVETGEDATFGIVADAGALTVETTSAGENVVLDTDLVSGVLYDLHIDAASGPTSVTLRDGTGAVVVSDDSPSLDRTVSFTVPEDGIYTILLDPRGSVTGSWRCDLTARMAAPMVGLPETATGWYTTSAVSVTWPTWSAQPIAGYALVLDEFPTTEPTVTTTVDDNGAITVPDGESWLHVRAVLDDGTLGPTTHTLIQVDTVAPSLGPLSSSTHPDTSALYAALTVQLAWGAASDEGSGVAGYSIEASKSPSSEPDAEIDTTDTQNAFNLIDNGLWYLRVRAVDAAGNAGEPESYEVNVAGEAPAAPRVTATHEDGIESGRRTLIADFTSGDTNVVSQWSAVVDQDPDTVPDPAAGHVEPRLVATLQPGEWWLHVSAGDALGRWGPPTHLHVIVTDDAVAILQADDVWAWQSTSIDLACPTDVTGLDLVTIDELGATTAIGALSANGGTCTVAWDPADLVGGQRVWPDGDYQLVVVDGEGNEVSGRVSVIVAVASNAVDRVLSEYRAGILDAAQLVDLLVRMLTEPASVPIRYLDGSDEGGMTTEVVLSALSLLDPELREAFIEALTPQEAPGASVPSLRGFSGVRGEAADAEAVCILFAGTAPNCYVEFPGFTIYYIPADVGVPNDYVGIPSRVQTVYEALAYAKLTYEAMGFATPSRTIRVNLVGGPFIQPGVGISLPTGVINMNVTTRADYYLPTHEYFHQVQYEYVNGWDSQSDEYWWMEATAEWAAHRVQEQGDFPGEASAAYASNLKGFLSSTASLHIPQSALFSGRGDEYGAFILAEYLEDRFGGDEAIRWTWDRIGDGVFGVRPLDAIDDYVQSQGATYAEAIEEFRLWTYVLGESGNIGFSDPDAGPGGFWRQRLNNDETFRRVTATASIDTGTRSASGSASVAASNTAYIEITKPVGIGGVASVAVTGSSSRVDLSNVRLSVVPLSEYPALCGEAQGLGQSAEPPVASRSSMESVDVLQGSFAVSTTCSIITLAVTNASKAGPTPFTFDWAVTFDPESVVLNNGVVEMGVNNSGTISTDGVGVRRAGDPETEVASRTWDSTTWGVADGTQSGSITAYSVVPDGMLATTEFNIDGQTAEVGAGLLDSFSRPYQQTLAIQMSFHPSASPSLYAIDVQIERTALASTSGDVLFQTMLDFDVPPDPGNETLTWDSPADEVPPFVTSLGHFTLPRADPLTTLGQASVLGETYGPADLGASIGLDLGDLAVGDSVSFTMYIGVTPGPQSASWAINAVDPAAYAFAQPGAGPGTTGGVTGIFAISYLMRHYA